MLDFIATMVYGEGGDGWAWIQVEDYETWAQEFVEHNALQYADIMKRDNMICISQEQEAWTFSDKSPLGYFPKVYDFLFTIGE